MSESTTVREALEAVRDDIREDVRNLRAHAEEITSDDPLVVHRLKAAIETVATRAEALDAILAELTAALGGGHE